MSFKKTTRGININQAFEPTSPTTLIHPYAPLRLTPLDPLPTLTIQLSPTPRIPSAHLLCFL